LAIATICNAISVRTARGFGVVLVNPARLYGCPGSKAGKIARCLRNSRRWRSEICRGVTWGYISIMAGLLPGELLLYCATVSRSMMIRGKNANRLQQIPGELENGDPACNLEAGREPLRVLRGEKRDGGVALANASGVTVYVP
jgi:hypothetical protein